MNHTVSNVNQVKATNISRIKSALKQLPYGTKTTVARITGLSVATCNTILNELAERNEILETEYPQASIGRPPKAYKFNEDYAFVCCVNITIAPGGRNLRYNIMNLSSIVHGSETLFYETVDFQTLLTLLQDLTARYPSIKVISIGLPGVVSENSIKFSNIEELNIPSMAGKLQKVLDRTIVIENDMNAIAYGFHYDGLAESDNSLVMLSFFKGACPGAGIIVDGNILRGNTNFAGEVSRLPYSSMINWRDLEQHPDKLAAYIGSSIAAITAILDPEIIILTGEALSSDITDLAIKHLQNYIPMEHQSCIQLISRTGGAYMKGLMAIAMEHLEV